MEVVLCVCMHRLRKMKRMNEAEEGGQQAGIKQKTNVHVTRSRTSQGHIMSLCCAAVFLYSFQ